MRWLLVCTYMSATASASLRLTCDPPYCYNKNQTSNQWLEYYIEGDQVKIENIETRLHIHCNGVNALQRHMPYFASELHVSVLKLTRCPLPIFHNASLVNALSAMNVTLKPALGVISLTLDKFKYQLAAHQFHGLDQLTNFTMGYSTVKLPYDLFTQTPNLRSLSLDGVRLPSSGLSFLPSPIESLSLKGQSSAVLPETLPELFSEMKLKLPNLVDITVDRLLSKRMNETVQVQTNETSSIESLRLYFWAERRLAPFKGWQCENLRLFEMSRSHLEELPDSMVAKCPRLEEVAVDVSDIKTLPSRLLEGASALKRFTMSSGRLQSLSEGLFRGAPNLVAIDLSYNSLQTLPSGIFVGLPHLQSLSLHHNKLDNSIISEMASLTVLTDLNLASNRLDKLCEKNGYSPLQNLINLKRLDLSANSDSTICRDWRENMTLMEYINLNSERITYLEYSDFKYNRDVTVKNSVVRLGGWKVIVDFTEDDYKKALSAPETAATLSFMDEKSYSHFGRVCDCRMYWLRRAMQDASQAVKVRRLKCDSGSFLEDIKPQQLCPERVSTTTEEALANTTI